MSSCNILLVFVVSGLLNTSWAETNADKVECAYAPYLTCSTQHQQLWHKADFNNPAPIVADLNNTYLSHNNTAYSYDLYTGALKWEVHTQNDARYFYPVLAEKYIYLARTDGILEKRQLDTGDIVWSHSIGKGWVYPPVITENSVITAGQDRTLWSLNKRSGKLQNTIKLQQELVTPLFRVGTKFIASTFDGAVSAYSLTPGEPQWSAYLDAPVFAHYRHGKDLITADMGGNVSAIDLNTGALRWQQKVHANALFWSVVYQQHFYSLTDTGTLTILDINSGELRDSFTFANRFSQAPIVQDDTIVLFDTEGSKLHVSFDALNKNQINPSITLN